MKMQMMMRQAIRYKNIIFDLHGVLFAQAQPGASKRFMPIHAGISLLSACKESTNVHKIVGCTNWSPDKVALLQEEYPEIMGLFDGIVTASAAQARKPDQKIFHYLFATYDVDPAQTIFVDDQCDNILGGRSVGLTAFHLPDPESFEKAHAEITKLLHVS